MLGLWERCSWGVGLSDKMVVVESGVEMVLEAARRSSEFMGMLYFCWDFKTEVVGLL
jgi:hypothetical protein